MVNTTNDSETARIFQSNYPDTSKCYWIWSTIHNLCIIRFLQWQLTLISPPKEKADLSNATFPMTPYFPIVSFKLHPLPDWLWHKICPAVKEQIRVFALSWFQDVVRRNNFESRVICSDPAINRMTNITCVMTSASILSMVINHSKKLVRFLRGRMFALYAWRQKLFVYCQHQRIVNHFL